MKKRNCLTALVFMAVCTGGVFAHEHYIKPTLSFGGARITRRFENGSLGSDTFPLLPHIDVDFVNFFGLTFGLQCGFLHWEERQDDGSGSYSPHTETKIQTIVPFGVGYTYTTHRWSIGAKAMTFLWEGDRAFGYEINGTYWFRNRVTGLTAAFSYYDNNKESRCYFLRGGISTRF